LRMTADQIADLEDFMTAAATVDVPDSAAE
jgi:hypothetical protein